MWVVFGSLLVQVILSPTLMLTWTGENHGWIFPMFTGWSTATAQEDVAPNTTSATKTRVANTHFEVFIAFSLLKAL